MHVLPQRMVFARCSLGGEENPDPPSYKAINCLTKITNKYRRIEPVPVCLLGVAKRMEDGLPCPRVEALDRQSDLRMWLQAGSPRGPWA